MKNKNAILPLLLFLPASMSAATPDEPLTATTSAPDALLTDSVADIATELDDFVVVADRPIVHTDGAKLTYNMEEDPAAKGNTLLDALKKVPMVSVDGDDNIRINGESNFKIYVNGKEDPALSANYKNIFKAMPAESVVKVEVITEPGARYDAEGTAGIINLVTISKNSTDGYSGSVSASFSKKQAGGSLYGRMRKGKLALSANADYADGSIFKQSNTGETLTENLQSETRRFQVSRQRQNVGFRYAGAGLHFSYDLTDNDLLTADGTFYSVKGWISDASFSSSILSADGSLFGLSSRDAHGKIANTGVNAGTSWQHTFDEAGQKLILSYLFNYGYNNLNADFVQDKAEGAAIASPFQRSDNSEWNHEHTVQADYINPFGGETHTLETGAKAVWRRNDAFAGNFYGNSAADAAESLAERSDITQKQDIYAVYASYNGKFGNLKATAGLRYEHTRMGIDFHYGDYTDFSKELNDVVPNAAIAYNFSHTSNLRLAYQMRISRPSLNQVNPFRLSIDPYQVETGNPDLGSEKSNKVAVTYSNFGGPLGGNVAIEYSTINNVISRYKYMADDVLYSSFANLGKSRNLSLSGYMQWTIIPRMQFTLNARISRQWFSAKSPDLSNKGWRLNYGANWSYSLSSGFRFNVYGGQLTRSYNLQGHNDGWYYYGVGLSKSFLKNDALTITLNASDFLQDSSSYKSVSRDENLITSTKYINKDWNVGISLSWNFGSLKTDVKRTSAAIDNDDKSSVGAKSGNGL